MDLSGLTPDFRARLEQLLEACRARGVVMVPYLGIRTPADQAALWKQGRTAAAIAAELARLRSAGGGYLADLVEGAVPRGTKRVTNALPGLSWHQWGEACDCYWRVDGKACWAVPTGNLGYAIYAAEAKHLGLTAGGYFTTLADWPHVQLRTLGSPARLYALTEIDARMRERGLRVNHMRLVTLLFAAAALAAAQAPNQPEYFIAAGAGWNHYATPQARGFLNFAARIGDRSYSFTTLEMTSAASSLRTGYARLLIQEDGFTLLAIGDGGLAAGSGEVGAAVSAGGALAYDITRWTKVPKTHAFAAVRVLKTGLESVQPVFAIGIGKSF